MARKTIVYVEDFIRSVQQNLAPGLPHGPGGLWISRHDEGSIFLDDAEREGYSNTVGRLVDEFAKAGDLSRRSVETYLQDSLFHALDIRNKTPKTFQVRLTEAVRDLLTVLLSPPLSYKCFVPIRGLSPKDLPFVFGNVRFVRFGQAHKRQILEPVQGDSKSRSFRRLAGDLKDRDLWGNPCAVVAVEARDFDSAAIRARVAIRAAVDSINFFDELVPYNHGWLYLPSEGGRALEIAPIVSSDGQVLLPHKVVGPLANFSLENLRKDRRVLRQVQALSLLSRTATPKTAGEVLLTAVRWAGRASVESKREQSFLLFAIALETVVLPLHSQELTYRLSLRVSTLLGRTNAQRAGIRKAVSDFYGVRSKIAHSGSYEVTDENLGRLRWITKAALLKLLPRRSLWKWPVQTFDAWLEERVTG